MASPPLPILLQNGRLATPSAWRWLLCRPSPLVPAEAEAILSSQPITTEIIEQAANAAMNACTPISDTRGSARYRKQMVRNLTRQAVTEVWQAL
ncbi:MAG: hypothetical protein M5U34_38350 [Chloroflexi bacterium]|nr:hypothetical protein [Chloroflexota bacterium]